MSASTSSNKYYKGNHSLKDKILLELKSKGARTASQMAELFDITAMGVRQHLYQLQEDGLVDHYDEKRKVGRPARFWRLTGGADDYFPDGHDTLLSGMLGAMQEIFGDEGMERLIAQRTKQIADSYGKRMSAANGKIEKRVEILCELRCEEGYMAEWSREADGSFMLIENHCPICVAAHACQGFCGSELELFRQLLGPGLSVERTEHILEGARRCAYQIRPAK